MSDVITLLEDGYSKILSSVSLFHIMEHLGHGFQLNLRAILGWLMNGSLVKNLPASTGRHKRPGSNPSVGKISWRRKWPPTPVFLPGKSHEQWSQQTVIHRVTQSQTQLKPLSMMEVQAM